MPYWISSCRYVTVRPRRLLVGWGGGLPQRAASLINTPDDFMRMACKMRRFWWWTGESEFVCMSHLSAGEALTPAKKLASLNITVTASEAQLWRRLWARHEIIQCTYPFYVLSQWNGHISAANRGSVSVSVRVKAVWPALPRGTSVFAALPSSLSDFDNDIDLDCRWGAVLHQSKSIKRFKHW